MNDDFSARRRRLLRGAGVGGTALLAGCTEQLGLGQNDNNSSDDTDTDTDLPDGHREAGIVAALDQEALQQAQVEVQEQMQSENMSQQEAQKALQERQQEIVSEGVSSLADELGSNVTVEQKYTDIAALHISGPPGALLDALELEASQSLVTVAQLEGAQSQSGS